jgi:hypothetical protein
MEPVTQPKLYRLQHDPIHFYAGHLADKTQVFRSPDYPHLFAVFFDAEGRYLEHVIRDMSPEIQSAMARWFASKSGLKQDEDFAKQWEDLDRWAVELGFTEGTIFFQKFCLPEHKLCIYDLPEIYRE